MIYTAENIKWYAKHAAPWGKTVFTWWISYCLPAVVHRHHHRRDGKGQVSGYCIKGGYADFVRVKSVDDMLAVVNEYNRQKGDSDDYVRIFGILTELHNPGPNDFVRYTEEEIARLPRPLYWEKKGRQLCVK